MDIIPGVEILSQEDILYTPAWVFPLLIVGIFCMAFFFSAFIVSILEKMFRIVPVFGLGFIITLVALIALFGWIDKPTGTYTYKVTVSDDVKMNEFLEQYEIVSQEGKIYTVKLRSTEDQ